MKCPACGNALEKKEAGGVVVDVCDGGCGGIWFDNFELKKFDEPKESAGEQLLQVEKSGNITIDANAKRPCPKCSGITMTKHFFSVKREVEIDDCPQCGGVWLDVGELGRIRKMFDSEEDRKNAASSYFNDIIDAGTNQVRLESQEKTARAKTFANMFRYLCPSNYLPGNQKWGAF